MNFIYRQGTIADLKELKFLGIKSWSPFKQSLTEDNWNSYTLTDDKTYLKLLESNCIVCTIDSDKIIGMVFLVSRGNPTEIYLKEWSYIRFLSVDPGQNGQGIGRKLINLCIDIARQNGENIIALHTS